MFVRANATASQPWRISPLSSEEHGSMTFTEIELVAFLHKRDELNPIFKNLIGSIDLQRRLTQTELTQDWLQVQTPGMLIQRLIAPVDPRTNNGDRLRGQQKTRAGVVVAVKIVEPEEVHNVFKTAADVVERLLGCMPDEADKVSYLGLDLGQASVVGAYGLLLQNKALRVGK
ncbi:hypothetical protein BGZ95_000417 [Linnemannia exigua]|uniref:Uncharacterized protein n=1 Tax=Linnemannia exigua TaxID=604196 RepID=A0AAD4DA09_9FUNG|nr:hypothetical protein BGZ95_000417 [Linnemannia exigua]